MTQLSFDHFSRLQSLGLNNSDFRFGSAAAVKGRVKVPVGARHMINETLLSNKASSSTLEKLLTTQWFWKVENWLEFPKLPEELLDKAAQIQEREKSLFDVNIIGKYLRDTLISESLTNTIRSNYQIEDMQLDSFQIHSEIISQLSLNVPEYSSQATQISPKTAQSVRATLEMLKSDNFLSLKKIKDIHKLLATDHPDDSGEFRDSPVTIQSPCDGGRGIKVIYVAPPESQVEMLMNKFCRLWNSTVSSYDRARKGEEQFVLPPPVFSALSHAFFLLIHPFGDGNGRMSRLIADKALAIGANDTYRPYSIVQEIELKKHVYYKHLDLITDEHQDGLLRFVDFLLDCQNDSISRAELRFESLQNSQEFIKQTEKLFGFQYNDLEKKVIKTIALDPTRKEWGAYSLYQGIENSSGDTEFNKKLYEDLEKIVEKFSSLKLMTETGTLNYEHINLAKPGDFLVTSFDAAIKIKNQNQCKPQCKPK